MKLRKIENPDLTMFRQIPTVAEAIKEMLTTKTEKMFMDLVAKQCNNVLAAVDQGKPFVTNVMSYPSEIYRAMDIADIEYDFIGGFGAFMLANKEDIFNAAKAIGVRPEICSAQRAPIGWFAKGWYPKPTAIINTNLCQCDNCAANGFLMGALYDVPTFCVNRPYRFWHQKGIDMMVGELKDSIDFLEKTTGHKMNWDKLVEAVKLTKKMMELGVETHNLSNTGKPYPIKAGEAFQLHFLRYMFAGTQEGVDYCQTFLDEMKEVIATGKGYGAPEKYRLASCYTILPGMVSFLSWMEEEKGAYLVSEVMYHGIDEKWLEKMDPSKPLEALAILFYAEPYFRFYGPFEEFKNMIIKDAIDCKVDGALNFFNVGCRMTGATARALKDQLREKVGIPTLTIDVDVMEQSPVVEEALKKQLEQFLLVLDSEKKKKKKAA